MNDIQSLYDKLTQIPIPFAYNNFPKDETPAMPYGCIPPAEPIRSMQTERSTLFLGTYRSSCTPNTSGLVWSAK